jgi:hypothetical protein
MVGGAEKGCVSTRHKGATQGAALQQRIQQPQRLPAIVTR